MLSAKFSQRCLWLSNWKNSRSPWYDRVVAISSRSAASLAFSGGDSRSGATLPALYRGLAVNGPA